MTTPICPTCQRAARHTAIACPDPFHGQCHDCGHQDCVCPVDPCGACGGSGRLYSDQNPFVHKVCGKCDGSGTEGRS